MKIFIIAIVACLLNACAFLDFGGGKLKELDWDFKFGWDHGINIGQEDPNNPGFDKDGNKIPSPDTLAAYQFPSVHTGYMWLETARITPTLSMTICEIKVPYLRWWSVQAGGGSDMIYIALNKRLTNGFEITIGPAYIYDFTTNDGVIGAGVTILKW